MSTALGGLVSSRLSALTSVRSSYAAVLITVDALGRKSCRSTEKKSVNQMITYLQVQEDCMR